VRSRCSDGFVRSSTTSHHAQNGTPAAQPTRAGATAAAATDASSGVRIVTP